MANAIPVNSKPKNRREEKVEVVALDPEKSDELLAKAREIAASEKPAQILDSQVNQIGQERSYGNVKRVVEMEYPVKNRKGEETGETRTHLRIDH